MNTSRAAVEKHIAEQVRQLAAALQQNGFIVVTAESCTGGMLAGVLTELAGSSAWFEGGWVTYSNALKRQQLGVPAEVLGRHGAVSLPVVEAMAEGALTRSQANMAVSISGVAGPEGGTVAKPVGTVCFGLAYRGDKAHSWQCQFDGDRQQIRQQAVSEALSGMLALVSKQQKA